MMKLFRTVNYDVIRDCCKFFEFTLPSKHLVKKSEKFILRYKHCSSLHWYFAISVKCVLIVFFSFLLICVIS